MRKQHNKTQSKYKSEKHSNFLAEKSAERHKLVLYDPHFLKADDRDAILKYLKTIYPIWEQRFSEHNPPPPGQSQRWLLRPVYWLGNWQFACLDYYHPPKGIFNRCVQAEPFPPILQKLVHQFEQIVHQNYTPRDIPNGWHLNTCLINYYGSKIEDGKAIDTARVGEHKDFEPGPVASLSLGERALFQFVDSQGKGRDSHVVMQQWLDDGSLQIFGGDKFKKKLFHRVQRVDKKTGIVFKELNTTQFETRRLNFTFRYVPNEHIVAIDRLPVEQQHDISEYIQALAKHSEFFKKLNVASK